MFKIYVRAIIENEKGQFLYVQKNENQKIAPGKILVPGGSVEFGETPEQALKREVFEEVGLEVIDFEIYGTKTIILGETHWIGIYFVCKTKNLHLENKEIEKHSRVFWGEKEIFFQNFPKNIIQ